MFKFAVSWMLLLTTFFVIAEAQADPSQDLAIGLRERGAVDLTRSDEWPRGEVALTFDDGPHISFTPKVLNLLKVHDLHATFFVVGQNINRYTYPLIVRMRTEGHQIGSHSYNHDVKMATHEGRRAVEYIRGEHEVTQLLVNLALIATSPDDFDQVYLEVFQQKSGRTISNEALAIHWKEYNARFETVLTRLGFENGKYPYPVLFSRPPGGGPYLGQGSKAARDRYDLALKHLGSINVLWHGGCWDPNPARRREYDFILNSLVSQSKQGGILVIHDYVRYDALAAAIGRLASNSSLSIVLLEPAVLRKYGSPATVIVAAMQQTSGGPNLVATHEQPPAPESIASQQLAKSSKAASGGRT